MVLRFDRDLFASTRHRKIAAEVLDYLRKAEPRPAFDMPADELNGMVHDSIRCAETLKIDQISAHKRFAYLWVLSGGALGQEQEAIDYIRLGGPDPNEQVKALLQHTIAAIRQGSERMDPDA